nr:hypothetical protein BaRGS_019828 [Batillaria attramentaria]
MTGVQANDAEAKCACKRRTPRAHARHWFQGYGTKKQHPMYSTEANKYGGKPPSVHTMPTQFHARTQKFSKHLGACGMYRNHSLNTDLDRSNVPSGLPYSV